MVTTSAFSWLLALLLMVSPLAAVPDGQQGAYDVSFTWHSPSFDGMDEEANALFASFFDAAGLRGSYAALNGATYHDMDFLIDGTPALSIDAYASDQGVFVNSPLLNGAVGIDLSGQMDQVLQYADVDPGLFAIMAGISNAVTVFANLEEQGGLLPVEAAAEEVLTQIMAKAQTIAANPEPYAGIILSALGVETSSANVYTVTSADWVDLIRGILLTLADRDDYWHSVMTLMDMDTLLQSESVAREDVIAAVREMLLEAADSLEWSDNDAVVQVYECLDASGNPVLYQVKVVPDTGYGYNASDVSMLEWVPGKPGFYANLRTEPTSVEIKLSAAENDGWLAFLQVSDRWDVTTLMLRASGDENGASVALAELEDGQVQWEVSVDYACDANRAELTVGLGDALVRAPVITVAVDYTDVAALPRFDPDAFAGDIQYPLEMDAAELARFEQMVEIGAAQTLTRILGMLPPDVFGALMGSLYWLF